MIEESEDSECSTPVYPLDPMYINERRVATFVGAECLSSVLSNVSGWNERKTGHLRSVACAEVLRDWLEEAGGDIAALHALCIANKLKAGLLFTYEGNLYFRNARGEKPSPTPSAYVVLKNLGAALGDMKLELLLHPDHVVVGSPGQHLHGQVSDLFVLAQVQKVSGAAVQAVPVFIGYLRRQGPMEYIWPTSRGELFVDGIDNFAVVAKVPTPSTSEVAVLRNISEEQIKIAFAEILGEPDIPKDWGGERSDLFTTQLRVEGYRLSAAFAFKGAAGGKKFREMRIADLGKNGDQIERLCTEPADVLVIQHCHKIGSAVRNTVRAFCNQIGRQRKYCLISGHDTVRVLKAYSKCGL